MKVLNICKAIVIIFPILLGVIGCSVLEARRQGQIVEGLAKLEGKVEDTTGGQHVYAGIFEFKNNAFSLLSRELVDEDGTYSFNVLPGEFSVSAFVDSNNSGEYETGEAATFYGIENGMPSTIAVEPNSVAQLDTLTIVGPLQEIESVNVSTDLNLTNQNLGRVVTLDEPMFSLDAISVGLWRPVEYLDTYGGGLMWLQPYESNKIPVLFVHGISDSAASFKVLSDSLDRSRFQTWVLQYPSGMDLDVISEYVEDSLEKLQARYQFNEIVVIAHSMGGLVTRSFVKKYSEKDRPYTLKFVMTINSPLYGMDSAISGVNYSPVVVPSWRNIASNSEFIKILHEWHWPKSIPYFLIFSYLPDMDSDRVVPLKSQLSISLQEEAVGTLGFESEHTEILSKPDFIQKFNEILNSQLD